MIEHDVRKLTRTLDLLIGAAALSGGLLLALIGFLVWWRVL